MAKPNLLYVKKCDETDLPVSKGTVYNWHSAGLHPDVVYKVKGVLVFDLDAWYLAAAESKNKTTNES